MNTYIKAFTAHYGPRDTVEPTRRKNGILYKLARAVTSRKGGVIATYELL